MTKNNNIPSLLSAFILVMLGSLSILTNNQLFSGPIFLTLGIIFAISIIFKSKEYYNKIISTPIVAVMLIIMLIGEFILVPTENEVFYILILIMAATIFISAYFFFSPEDSLTKRDKMTMWAGLVIYMIILFLLYGVVYNNFRLTLITGIVVSIAVLFGLILRKWKFGKVF